MPYAVTLLSTVHSKMPMTVYLAYPPNEEKSCKQLETALLSMNVKYLKLVQIFTSTDDAPWNLLFPTLSSKGLLKIVDHHLKHNKFCLNKIIVI